jgi:hypothetical protein
VINPDIPPLAITKSIDREQSSRLLPYKAFFLYRGGYIAARELISRKITHDFAYIFAAQDHIMYSNFKILIYLWYSIQIVVL